MMSLRPLSRLCLSFGCLVSHSKGWTVHSQTFSRASILLPRGGGGGEQTTKLFSSASAESGGSGVDHVVLLKVNPETSEETLQEMYKALQALTETVPGVQTVRVGESFVEDWMDDRRQEFTHYLRVRLESRDALKIYQDHPEHVKVVTEHIKPNLTGPPLAIDCDAPEVD